MKHSNSEAELIPGNMAQQRNDDTKRERRFGPMCVAANILEGIDGVRPKGGALPPYTAFLYFPLPTSTSPPETSTPCWHAPSQCLQRPLYLVIMFILLLHSITTSMTNMMALYITVLPLLMVFRPARGR